MYVCFSYNSNKEIYNYMSIKAFELEVVLEMCRTAQLFETY